MTHDLFDKSTQKIPLALLKDQTIFQKRLRGLKNRKKKQQAFDKGLSNLVQDIDFSISKRTARAASLPVPQYDEGLPVCQLRQEIEHCIQNHQVSIIAGETGSGKTTQLPKICLSLGYGVAGVIGCTQPRRIAARSVSERVAEELKIVDRSQIAYQIRFQDYSNESTLVKFMTDGILLAETQNSPNLDQYEVLIIDEAHERSLNIDFLLGYLKQLLPKRPDLKVIITSATIDTERFSKHFNDAPVVKVSGRSYPVGIRYQVKNSDSDKTQDLALQVYQAVQELDREDPRGDVLVFLSSERDIHEIADFLRKQHLKHTEILPLFARLNAKDQYRIFHPGPQRRIILSTNIAETSLTVPRIKFVIDSGLARISRYNPKSKIQRLPIEPIAQAAANQRSGRCGRLGPGICIRLYSQEDFQNRPAFTQPEIQRTALSSVILQMQKLKLGQIREFPFMDPPSENLVKDGFQELTELQALDDQDKLTLIGQQLSRLPIDVRLGRILLSGAEHQCLSEMLVIGAALSIQDPRERPQDAKQAADQAHQVFKTAGSDFMSLLKLWSWIQKEKKALTNKAFKTACQKQFLNFMRILEWQDLLRQLSALAQELKLPFNEKTADEDRIHQALIPGFLSHIGMQEEKSLFQGAKGKKFNIFPGSQAFKKPGKWIVAAELVETSKIYARVCAPIDPKWLEAAGQHLLKHHYYEAFWSKKAGRVLANLQITLYGLPIVRGRKINYASIDPVQTRKLFISDGLVQGQFTKLPKAVANNLKQIAEIEAMENRQRRQNILISPEDIAALYDRVLPENILDLAGLNKWLKIPSHSASLTFEAEDLYQQTASSVSETLYPDVLTINQHTYPLSYHFQPGEHSDGVTLHIPLSHLKQIPEALLSWLVPGMVREKLEQLIKGLPKSERKALVPIPDTVSFLLDFVQTDQHSIESWLAETLFRKKGIKIDKQLFESVTVDPHLLMNIRVENEQGRSLGQSRDLSALQNEFAQQARHAFVKSSQHQFHQKAVQTWDFGVLPIEAHSQANIKIFPALDASSGTLPDLKAFETPEQAESAHLEGLVQLVKHTIHKIYKETLRKMPLTPKACMEYLSIDSCENLKQDIVSSVLHDLVEQYPHPVRSPDAFDHVCRSVEKKLYPDSAAVCALLEQILPSLHLIQTQIARLEEHTAYDESLEDINSQIENLIYPGFLLEITPSRLAHYPRYLKALNSRIERMQNDLNKDLGKLNQIHPFWMKYLNYWEEKGVYTADYDRLRWLLEEYRVSLFAQEIKTAESVSEKKIRTALAKLN